MFFTFHLPSTPLFFSHSAHSSVALPSFPTRRSSDLVLHLPARLLPAMVVLLRGNAAARVRRVHDQPGHLLERLVRVLDLDRKSIRLNSSHLVISYAVFCLKKTKKGRSEYW